jgi:hypothetical protein
LRLRHCGHAWPRLDRPGRHRLHLRHRDYDWPRRLPCGRPCVPSSVCPSADAAVIADGTPPVDVVAVPMPLPLNTAPVDP